MSVGTVAYQKRRRTFCLVQSMDASSRGAQDAWRMAWRGSPVKIPVPSMSVTLCFGPDLAFMPRAQRQLGQADHDGEQAHARKRNEEECREQARDVELEA